MFKPILPIVLLSFLVSCSAHTPVNTNATIDKNTLNTDYVIALLFPTGGAGHACPCGDSVYTAGHIAADRDGKLRRFTWENGIGNTGNADAITYSRYRDLGKLKLGNFPDTYYQQATELPEEGELVLWVEYDDESLKPKVRGSEVVYYLAGYIFFKNPPSPGASGSCLFNSRGEVVGVVVWGLSKGTKSHGVGVLLVP